MVLVLDGRPFDRRTARAEGLGERRLRALLARGEVRQVLNEVYVDAAVADDLGLRIRCLRLRLPERAALSRRTAALLFGVMSGPSPSKGSRCWSSARFPWAMSLSAGLGSGATWHPCDQEDVVVIGGMACTSPERTAVDILRWLPPHEGLAVVDAMAARGLVDAATLPPVVERFAGGRGIVRARYLAAIVEPLTESPGESWLRLRLIDAGFPRPQAQIEVGPYRLDLGWPDRLVAIEYDGEEFHGSPRQRHHDERRRDELERRYGWKVLGVGKGEVLGPSLVLERAVGDLLSLEPRIRRRLW